MKIIYKVVLLGFAVLLFGCSKKIESTEELKSAADEKLRAESVEREKVKQPNIVTIPFDFKGVKLGQTVKELQQVFKITNNIYDKPSKSKIYLCDELTNHTKCSKIKGLTIANQVPEFAAFSFHEAALISTFIEFNEDYFDVVKEAFKQKYGDPTETDEATLTNKLTGVESMYENLIWSNNNGELLSISNHKKEGSAYIPKGKLWIYKSNGSRETEEVSKDI